MKFEYEAAQGGGLEASMPPCVDDEAELAWSWHRHRVQCYNKQTSAVVFILFSGRADCA
jgi:hypothetical protein